MIHLLGQPTCFEHLFRKPKIAFGSDSFWKSHVVAPLRLMEANTKFACAAPMLFYRVTIMYTPEILGGRYKKHVWMNSKELARSVIYPSVMFVTVFAAFFFPKTMCWAWGLTPVTANQPARQRRPILLNQQQAAWNQV